MHEFELLACHGKAKHKTKAMAERIRDNMSQAKDTKVAAYKCPICRAWHVGSATRKANQLKNVNYLSDREIEQEVKAVLVGDE